MKGLKIFLAGLAFLFTASTVNAIVITNAFMTDVEPSTCDPSRLRIVNTYYENRELACFFVSFDDSFIGDTYKTKWYHEGMLYIDGDTATVSSENLACMSRTMKISGAEPMNMPGQWQVEFYYNNERLLRWDFEIKERCAARTALSDDSESLNALRIFRDQTLYKTRFGQKAVSLFYEYSPALAKAMDDSPALKAGVRTLLKACASVLKEIN
jgi:hypothetical protein